MPKTFDTNDKMDFDKNQAFDQQLLQKTILKESMMKRVSENQKLHNIGRGKDGMLTQEELWEKLNNDKINEKDDLTQIRTRKNAHNIIEETRHYSSDIVKYLYDDRANKMSQLLVTASGKKIVAVVGFAFMDALESAWSLHKNSNNKLHQRFYNQKTIILIKYKKTRCFLCKANFEIF
ncbi:hypothetical protein RFI_28129 [Reticulomyxa filosa]|uniref:Uncharacterized protein n=1 Tax=Reticulomyxa filosa TaxID=46433 RepID=X6M5I9_RETFI|nr:hypothetical protein RFI_28129 [Reticulomyxa filosa]|eukprot:ETO09258.1 hypothetical protein RFI_28129 [Reticulomyxa filosa]